jgi:hypothetical protein
MAVDLGEHARVCRVGDVDHLQRVVDPHERGAAPEGQVGVDRPDAGGGRDPVQILARLRRHRLGRRPRMRILQIVRRDGQRTAGDQRGSRAGDQRCPG